MTKLLSKELREKIAKYKEELIWEEKKKKELLNRDIDYNFLQTLIAKCNDNPDLVVTIYFKSGDKMVLQTKYRDNSFSGVVYDGEPSANELDIR